MIILLSEVPVAPESRDEAIRIVKSMARVSRTEPGVIDYRVTTDLETPNIVRIIEQYEDSDAVEAHESSDHLKEFQRDIKPHVAGEPELYRYNVTAQSKMEGP